MAQRKRGSSLSNFNYKSDDLLLYNDISKNDLSQDDIKVENIQSKADLKNEEVVAFESQPSCSDQHYQSCLNHGASVIQAPVNS